MSQNPRSSLVSPIASSPTSNSLVWLVFGIRHQQAGVALREQFSFTEAEASRALTVLIQQEPLREVAILSTCNRTEIYVATPSPHEALRCLQAFFLREKGLGPLHYQDSVFHLEDEAVAHHLFRVTSGLDSLIVGEGQISGQVKDALAIAQSRGTCGIYLDKLFKSALTASKRVRTETGLSERNTSVSLAAFEFLRHRDPDLLNKKIAVLGGGKMAEKMLICLRDASTSAQRRNITIVNRSPNRLEELTDTFGFRGATWETLPSVLATHPVLFVATGAPHWVLETGDFSSGLISEHLNGMTILDISMPRNVDPAVAEIPGVTLFNIDDLGHEEFSPVRQAQKQAEREQQALLTMAERLIEEALSDLRQWRNSLPVLSTLTQWRAKVEDLRQQELQKVQGMLSETAFAAFEAMSRTLINKILHEPSVRLKNAGTIEETLRYTETLSHLFDLNPLNPLERELDDSSGVSSFEAGDLRTSSERELSQTISVNALPLNVEAALDTGTKTMRLLRWLKPDDVLSVES